ncbi:NAD(P)H-dependent flavin oxidoreductase [Antrihabitans spumae]|uniref:Propionate 3-nitronate monooxygenase n=1 Tax=Antrihabitans spumae TaxID=3373370 RepID=A0ABW7KTY2_9NOCA
MGFELPSRLPIFGAPMAGGPSTAALAVAVSEAGGLGFLAAGSTTPEALDTALGEVERRTSKPYGVNVFLPSTPSADAAGLQAYRRAIAPFAERLGVDVGQPGWNDDFLDTKIDLIARRRPTIVSFTFGLPGRDLSERVRRDTGASIAVTVTSVPDAIAAVADGADLLVVQGIEAGGHRSLFTDNAADPYGGAASSLATLLTDVRAAVEVPLIAAGGIMDGAAVTSVLRLGAVAAQLGTAFLCCPEAGTPDFHRRALLSRAYSETIVTRAFSGRPARGLLNEFARANSAIAPAAYPEVLYLTKAMKAAAAAAGDADVPNLWAGTGWRAVTEAAAGDIVARLEREMASV